MSKFDRAGLLIFMLVFLSGDFELGRNVSCEESTISGLFRTCMWKILLDVLVKV